MKALTQTCLKCGAYPLVDSRDANARREFVCRGCGARHILNAMGHWEYVMPLRIQATDVPRPVLSHRDIPESTIVPLEIPKGDAMSKPNDGPMSRQSIAMLVVAAVVLIGLGFTSGLLIGILRCGGG